MPMSLSTTTMGPRRRGPGNPWPRVLRRWRDIGGLLIAVAFGLGGSVALAASYTATWTQLSTSNTPGAPAWRGWTAMTWVGTENRIVMWGGSGAVFMNDVVGLDPVGGGWTTFEPSTNCPGNTQWAPPNGSDENGVVHDPLNDQLWLYNGGSGYRCATTAAVGRTAGAGTTSTSIVDPTLPSTVTDHYKDWTVRVPNGTKVRVNAYNAGTKTLTLSAAVPVSAGGAYDLYVDFGDGTWSYSFVTGQYAKLSSRHFGYNGYVPPARKSPGFAGDATRAILFGGADFDNGTYKLDFATRSYSVAIPQGLSTSPAARGQIPHQFVYDTVHDRFVLFGGRCFDPGRCSYQNMLDDTWIYNANTNAWTQVTPALRPAARNQGQMYFDAGQGRGGAVRRHGQRGRAAERPVDVRRGDADVDAAGAAADQSGRHLPGADRLRADHELRLSGVWACGPGPRWPTVRGGCAWRRAGAAATRRRSRASRRRLRPRWWANRSRCRRRAAAIRAVRS